MRERLGDALARRPPVDRPTAWAFDGVISYLTPGQVGEAFDAIAAQSAPGSRLLATYNEPSRARRLFSDATQRWVPEPPRASFSPEERGRLLHARGFIVRSDRDGIERARRLQLSPSAMDHVWIRAHHVVIADLVAARGLGGGWPIARDDAAAHARSGTPTRAAHDRVVVDPPYVID